MSNFEVSLQCPQKPASGPCFEPDESNPQLEALKSCKVKLNIKPQAYQLPMHISWLFEPLLGTEE
jgi:hypothetical protein